MIYRAQEYPEALEELFQILPDDTDRNQVIEAISRAWGGQLIYIPKRYGYQVTRRNSEMMKRYDGGNRDDLCKEYGIKKRQFYTILRLYSRKGLMK